MRNVDNHLFSKECFVGSVWRLLSFTLVGNHINSIYLAYRPETVAGLHEQIGEAIGSGELSVVEVPVDPGVNVELVRKLEAYWEERS